MNTGAKGVLLVIGAYVVTIVVAVLIISLAIMSVLALDINNCSTISRVMLALWGTIAALFIASVVVARVVAWKVIPSASGRVAFVVALGVALLASYVVIAFGLLVAFNC